MRKAAFHSLGCKVNTYETEAMRKSLLAEGYEEVPFAPGADVYVINTCTVTNIADRKSRQMLHKAKEMNPHACVVAVGCYAEDAGESLLADACVDLVIGNSEKGLLAERLEAFFGGKRDAGSIDGIASVREYEELPEGADTERTRAFLKIQDGCNQFCTYCRIPYVRGRVRSRDQAAALSEARHLAEQGFQEIVLTGIHLSSYGLDWAYPGENRQTPEADQAETNEYLLTLIRDLAAIPGVARIRLGSLEPGIMTERFVKELARIPEICPQFHLSLQSGSDSVLTRMRRRYRTEAYLEKCSLLRTYFVNPAITTDIIVGFPGETEEEFEETCRFAERASFSKIHIFPYSKRDGTVAARMEGQLTNAVKKERAARLARIEKDLRRAYTASFVGGEADVLFEEAVVRDGVRGFTGYTREYVPVFMMMEEDLTNRIVTVRCVASGADGLIGVRN